MSKNKNDLSAVERIVMLMRNLRSEELSTQTTLKEGGDSKPYIFGGDFDQTAYKEWYGNYRHRHFVVVDGEWESREVPGPEIETLPLKWGTKKGEYVIMRSRNRPWGDGGVSWGTKWRLPIAEKEEGHP